jgi:cellulose synthase/poly-beta-1,6-N-acetylglucosamine synthase-like glycosyltransferase
VTAETTLFIFILLLYLAQCALFTYGLLKARFDKDPFSQPRVSIVTAARNEEHNIAACIESLTRLEYPKDKLEIIIVDDNSTDATSNIIRGFADKHSNVKALNGNQTVGNLRGKANAIAQGIDMSSGEIIFMTDADCVVPPSWVQTTVQHYTDDIGVVAGLTLLQPAGWFAGMQSLDWAYILAVASASMALKNPLSCIGNNFSFRRKAYDEVGGYHGIKFSVTEDFALFKAITRSGRWGYRYPLEKESLVFSTACRTIPELYRQKRRWGVGGKDMPVSGLMIMAIAFCMHVFLLAGYFFNLGLIFLLCGFAVKFLCDFVLLSIPLIKTKQFAQLKYFGLFEIYFMLYVIILPFAVFLGGKVSWKGRKY